MRSLVRMSGYKARINNIARKLTVRVRVDTYIEGKVDQIAYTVKLHTPLPTVSYNYSEYRLAARLLCLLAEKGIWAWRNSCSSMVLTKS